MHFNRNNIPILAHNKEHKIEQYYTKHVTRYKNNNGMWNKME